MGDRPRTGSDSAVRRPLRICAEANAELNAAWNWYENQREGLGDDLLGCVDAAFAAVARAPELYVRVDGPIRRALVRRFPYIVLFREYPEYIAILAVFHTSRNPDEARGRG